jgi:hypothetical protein
MPPSPSESFASSEIARLRDRVNELQSQVWDHERRVIMAEFKISTMAGGLLIASVAVAVIAIIASIAQAD